MLRVGIVAEGPSDWWVLEEVMKAVHADIEFLPLRPDETIAVPRGWKGVKAWCREFGPQLEVFMNGVPGRPIHLLVIHVDCSMADKEGAERPCPPASDTAEALRGVVLASWLCRTPRPAFVVVANPSKTTDAWVTATLDPPHPNLANIECDKAVEDEFARRHLLPRKDGEVKKQARRYLPLAKQVGTRLDLVCDHCTQASAFRREFALAAMWWLWMS